MSESIPPIQPAPVAPAADTRSVEVLIHLSTLLGIFGALGIPLLNIIAPLILWLWKRNESLGVDAHGKEVLNFQISWTLYAVIAGTVTGVSMLILIGILMLPFLIFGLIVGWIAMLILTIIAAIKAGNGQLYRYPLTIRFLR